MNSEEWLNMLHELEKRTNEIVIELDDIRDECDDLYYEIKDLRKEMENDDITRKD